MRQRQIKKIPFCLGLNLSALVVLRCQQSGGGTVRTHGSHQLSIRIPSPCCQRDPRRAQPVPSPQHVGAPPAQAAVPPPTRGRAPRSPCRTHPPSPTPFRPAAPGARPEGRAGPGGAGGGRRRRGPAELPGAASWASWSAIS